MNHAPARTRSVLCAAALIAVTAACGDDTSSPGDTTGRTGPPWNEPASYTYTLTSTEQTLAGRFRVTVRNGEVAEATGLDAGGREVVGRGTGRIPRIGDLLNLLAEARHEHADTAEAEYAPDGHPVRIVLDDDTNAVDDEAEYVISAYEPAAG